MTNKYQELGLRWVDYYENGNTLSREIEHKIRSVFSIYLGNTKARGFNGKVEAIVETDLALTLNREFACQYLPIAQSEDICLKSAVEGVRAVLLSTGSYPQSSLSPKQRKDLLKPLALISQYD